MDKKRSTKSHETSRKYADFWLLASPSTLVDTFYPFGCERLPPHSSLRCKIFGKSANPSEVHALLILMAGAISKEAPPDEAQSFDRQ
jgi:hypothetical protein